MYFQQFEKQSKKLYESLLNKYFIIKNLKSDKANYLNGKPCQMVGYQIFKCGYELVRIHVKIILPELKDSTIYKLKCQNLDDFPKVLPNLKCSNHETFISEKQIYYKCSVCPEYYLCQECQYYNTVHPEHPFIKIRPHGWQPPLPIDLEIKQKQNTYRINQYYPDKKCLLTPKQAAVYDEMLRMDKTQQHTNNRQSAQRFQKLRKWMLLACTKAYYSLID